MLSIGTVVLGVADIPRAARFWSEALNYVPRDDEGDDTYVVLVPAAGTGTHLALGRSDSPVQEHPRVHLDLYAGNSSDQAAEVERLISLGAERVAWGLYPPDADFIVLADPEGNRFCFIDTAAGS